MGLPRFSGRRIGCLVLALAGCYSHSTANATYIATVLFQLNTPSGYSNGHPSSFADAAVGGQVVGQSILGSSNHAFLWTATAPTGVDLQPTGFSNSTTNGTDGSRQVGAGVGSVTANRTHALIWSGTKASAVDIHPSGFNESDAVSIAGNQQVGFGQIAVLGHYSALLWTGSAASMVNLQPAGFEETVGNGTDGVRQVGEGIGPVTNDHTHALLWSGSAASYIDLDPGYLNGSEAVGISGLQQVGYVGLNGGNAAELWFGSAASAVNLNPAGFDSSQAFGTNGSQQVGFGSTGGLNHALVWSGSAATAVDLNALLPSGFSSSYAYSLDSSGTIYGTAFNSTTGKNSAVSWTFVPEPSALGVCLMAAIAMRRRR